MILIAGCGFVGSEVARLFAAAGDEVVGLTHNEESAERTSRSLSIPVIACDISNQAAVDRVTKELNPSLVISTVSSRRGDAAVYREVYLTGSSNLLHRFSKARFLFVSSTSVYGQNTGEWVDESSPTEPASETSRVLLKAEEVVRKSGGSVVRSAGIYGPGRSVLVTRFLSGDAVIEGDCSRFVNQIHRDDLASALFFIGTRARSEGAEIFNAVDDSPMTQRQCYEWLSQHFNRPLPPVGQIKLERKRGVTNKRVSNTKLRSLGWAPRYSSFREGAAAMQEG